MVYIWARDLGGSQIKAFCLRSFLLLGTCALLISCSGVDGKQDALEETPASEGELLINLCPDRGCRVEISEVERQGGELQLTFEANFAPDLARNHLHVYWDNFSAQQVSVDAGIRFGVRQGDWTETDENVFVTSGATMVGARGDSMVICVTVADLNHSVIDPQHSDCFDVGELLL